MISKNRYTGKTLYSDEEEEDTPQPNTIREEPKVCLTLARFYVFMDWHNLTCLKC